MDKKGSLYLVAFLCTMLMVFRIAMISNLSNGLVAVLMLIFVVGEAIPVLGRFGYFSQETRISLWCSFMVIGFGALIYLAGVSTYNQNIFAKAPLGIVIVTVLYVLLLSIIFYVKQQIMISFDVPE
jgi:hypothetical protein